MARRGFDRTRLKHDIFKELHLLNLDGKLSRLVLIIGHQHIHS